MHTHGTVNETRIIGRLGHDPEFRFTTTGVTSATFPACTVMTWIDDAGEHEQLEWHRIIAWGTLADVMTPRI